MARRVDEIYCKAILTRNSFATYEPDRPLALGDFGYFTRDVIFNRSGSWVGREVTFGTVRGPETVQNITSQGVFRADGSVVLETDGLIDAVVSANASLLLKIGRGKEVLLLTATGRWLEIDDEIRLLEQLRDRIDQVPLGWMAVCRLFETDWAVAAISSSATTEFRISLDAGAKIAITPIGTSVRGGLLGVFTKALSQSRTWPISSTCQPLFGRGVRTRKQLMPLFGHPELLTATGDTFYRIVKKHPEQLAYDPSKAEASLEEIKAMPVYDLFEFVEPADFLSEIQRREATLPA